jgi:two-component system sensor histidine kinase ChiS
MNLMLRIAFLTVLVQMHCVVHVLAQATEIKFQRISLEDGLSQTSINCIIQDRKGFLWFGTQDGLNKYDGYIFTVFRNDSENPNSLSNNFITALHEDRYGYLWIGTSEGGLNRIDRDTQEFTKWVHEPGNPRSLGHNSVQSILEDREGILWLGTRGGGLQQYDRDADTFTGWVHEPENPKSLSHNFISPEFCTKSPKSH